jgi:replicative superfamily II helicase
MITQFKKDFTKKVDEFYHESKEFRTMVDGLVKKYQDDYVKNPTFRLLVNVHKPTGVGYILARTTIVTGINETKDIAVNIGKVENYPNWKKSKSVNDMAKKKLIKRVLSLMD